jgi:serine/threonine protein kinase
MIGKEIGNYKILKELGRGGMGVVYKCNQLTLGRMVAMKVLPSHLTTDGAFVKRFENEARAIAKLNHPNIVQIFDIGQENDIHYYTMEFVEGPSLDQVIYREGFMPLDRALNIVLQVARALQYAHSQGIIHRDIKPSNIMLDQSNHAKVADFGLALQERTTRLTVDGSIVGTPEYMSPEQAAAEPATLRSDIYSLGVVFYELLTGKVPFEGESALLILKKIQASEPEWPRSINSQIPIEVEKVIQRMMAKKARDRYANCKDVIQDLRRLKAGQPIPLKSKKRAGRIVGVAAVAGILILGGIMFYRLRERPHAGTPSPATLVPQEAPREEPRAEASLPPPAAPLASQPEAPPSSSQEQTTEGLDGRLAALEQRLDELRSQKKSSDALWADTLIFKKGNRINCTVVNESLEKVKIRTDSGLAEIPRNEIQLIVYATPEKKQAAETAGAQEQRRQQEEQQVRKEIAELEKRMKELEPQPQQLSAQPAEESPSAQNNSRAGPEQAPAETPASGERTEPISLPLREGKWHIAASCGKKTGISFDNDVLIVTTSQDAKEPSCSTVLETNEPLNAKLDSIEILVEVKQLITASDRITASLAISFSGGTMLEYPFFDSQAGRLSQETNETPERLRISRPENSVLAGQGWQTLRLPVAEDSGKINKGEKATRISLIHTQSEGKGVFLFRYKAIVLNPM